MPKKFLFVITIHALRVTVALVGTHCFSMEKFPLADFSRQNPKSLFALKLLQQAHASNDAKLYKSLLTTKLAFKDLEPVWPQIMRLSTRNHPLDASKPQSNPAFSEITNDYAVELETPIHTAARKNQLSLLEKSITKNNINSKNLNGETPLFIASFHDRHEIVRLLLSNGADVHVRGILGTQALHISRDIRITKLLCQFGALADLNSLDDFSQTPLFHAIGMSSHSVAAYLIDEGADVNIPSLCGETVFHNVCSNHFLKPQHALLLGKKLIQAGANPNAQSNDLRTPLHVAAEYNLLDLVQLLLQSGADHTVKDQWGVTPASIIENAWDTPIDEFIALTNNPDFKKIMLEKKEIRAKKSFEFTVPSRHCPSPKQKKDTTKKSHKKSGPTFNQRKEKREKARVSDTSSSDDSSKESPQAKAPTFVLDERVLNWRNNEWLLQEELRSKKLGSYDYWDFLRKRLYHRLPEQTLNTLFERGKQSSRPNETYTDMLDRMYEIEGEMQFKHNDNPWKPGKISQPGFYHMTRGVDGKVYHVGFKPITSSGKTLGDYLYAIPLEWESKETELYSATYDAHEGVRHVLYLNK